MTTLMQHPHHQSYPPQPSMLRMYPSSSTQQPAAQCLLRSPADAIHILESVRLGLIPRVTRRLTGHERAMIRPGTVWVWEEEETNMRRWTDGRRWGASRVGGGGFLVYREVEGSGGGRHDSPSASPPPSSRNSPTESSPRPGANGARKAGLVKQTYSTSMAHPVTGRVKKFHVVAYSCKSDPGHHALPLPHQLPHLAYVKIMPGVWPDWEQRQDENGAQKGKTAASQPQLVVPVQPAPARSPSASSYSGGPVRPPGPPSNGHSPGSRSGTPQYGSYYGNGSAATPGTPPSSEKDRYHPYRTGRPAGFPSSLAPSSAPYGSHPPPPGMYDRDSRSPGHPHPSGPYEHHWPTMGVHSRSTYPDEPSNGSASRAPPPPERPYSFYERDHAERERVERNFAERERERERDPEEPSNGSASRVPLPSERPPFFYSQRAPADRERDHNRDHDPVVSVRSPSPRAEAPIRSSYSAPFAHPSISAARDSHSRPGSPSLPPPDRNRIGIAGIMNDHSSNGSNGITLPPLRLALDGKDTGGRGGPSSPGSGNEDGVAAGGRKWGEDQRQLNQLGRMVGL